MPRSDPPPPPDPGPRPDRRAWLAVAWVAVAGTAYGRMVFDRKGRALLLRLRGILGRRRG